MKKTLIAIAATAATLTAVAAPAIATAAPRATVVVVADRYDRNDRHDRNDFRASAQLDNRIDRLENRIDAGRRTGGISAREGRRLDNELRSIMSQKRGFERTGRGLNSSEIHQLGNRLDRLEGQIRYERHDRDNRRW